MRRLAYGVGVALAVSFPAVAFGFILLAFDDRDVGLQPVVRAVLMMVVLAGPAVGGAAVARDASRVVRPAVGAIALVLIVVFGLAREAAADEDPNVALAVTAVWFGAALGWFGGVVGRAVTGRTRA